ncbi:MAG TPA: LysM peptidoglycan-binding domain-containing protein [Candidatus Dormibacteraeota bacterium]|nr:LysM peptidoglycan-binding domain-containing protein [Candidatus Dormibacteraeota bacterium]
MLNPMGGALRVLAQIATTGADNPSTGPANPATTRRAHRRAIGVARFLADTMTATPRARQRTKAVAQTQVHDRTERLVPPPATQRRSVRRRLYRRHLVLRLTSDRTLPIAIALIVLTAAGVSLAPAAAPVGAAQHVTDAGAVADAGGVADPAAGVRLAVGGGPGGPATVEGQAADVQATTPVDDGTVFKPVAVDTSIKSSAGMLQQYVVKSGDTLTGIASRFGVSMMTVWWANHLTSKDVHTGQTLTIPPVNGLVVTVQPGDTLNSIATANKIDIADIISLNDLQDPNLIVGQVLVLPGAKGDPMPTPAPTKQASSSGGGTSASGGSFVYVSGPWAWPVPAGYISQYFHYGHLGVDIAATYGSAILSPRAGTVVFAGWKDNGGGYQVWIYHGNGIYTGHHHMSRVLVSAGQTVAKGQIIGRIGQSGWATGPHDHFEVWVGYPWESGSYRINPLRYY